MKMTATEFTLTAFSDFSDEAIQQLDQDVLLATEHLTTEGITREEDLLACLLDVPETLTEALRQVNARLHVQNLAEENFPGFVHRQQQVEVDPSLLDFLQDSIKTYWHVVSHMVFTYQQMQNLLPSGTFEGNP